MSDRITDFDCGAAAYRSGHAWDSDAPADWRRGWIRAQMNKREKHAVEDRERRRETRDQRRRELTKPRADTGAAEAEDGL